MLKTFWKRLRCEHDYFIAKKYYDSYTDESGYYYKTVVYARYVLKCRNCGKRKDTEKSWLAHDKPKVQRDAELRERHERQMANRRRVGIGK